MLDTKVVSSCGPCLPPSKWRLDHVPDLMLDIIVDCLADDPTEDHPFDNPAYLGVYGFYPGMTGPVIISFSRDLKAMSLVTHGFRDNIMRRKIMESMILYATEKVSLALAKIRTESFGYIRHIILGGGFGSPHDGAILKGFLKRCSGIKSIIGTTQDLDYLAHPFPETMSDLRLIVASGEILPQPITGPGLRELWISASPYDKDEDIHSDEPIYFTAKVKHICQNVTNLAHLNLQPPGLSTSLTSRQDRLPLYLNLQDPLPKTLEDIRHLSVVIHKQFCTVDKGHPREAHWWGYYSWIITTAPKITEIELNMVWTAEYLFYDGDAGPYDILASMGLTTLKWDEENNALKTRPQDGRGTISPDMKDFMLLVLRARPELETITISHDLHIPARDELPLPFRRTVAIRLEGAGGQETVVFNDRIDYDLVDRTVQDYNELKDSWSDDASVAPDGSMISY